MSAGCRFVDRSRRPRTRALGAAARAACRPPPRRARAHKGRRVLSLASLSQPPLPSPNANQSVGDWLQGPYVYALYESYGYSPAAIGQLFVAGFGSSLVFGTVVGALGDRLGRRAASLLYVVTYALSCATKHSPAFAVLLLGRVLGGVATSLLFSAFEAWLVAEHFRRGYGDAALGDTFASAVLLGNGLMAIVAGFAGNLLVEGLGLGRVAPFDAAIVVMVAAGALMARTWPENYGDRASKGLGEQFGKALAAIAGGARVGGVFFFFVFVCVCVCLWVDGVKRASRRGDLDPPIRSQKHPLTLQLCQ